MIFSFRQLFIVVPIFIVTFSILFIKTQTLDVEQYNHVSSILRDIKQHNVKIDQDVIKIRQGLLKHYDTLDALSYKMTNSILRLKHGEDRILGLRGNIDKLISKLDSLAENKRTILQDYKLNHALLRNSLDYLPHSLERIEAEYHGKNDELHTVILNSVLAVMAYASSDDLHWADQANLNISNFSSLENNNVGLKEKHIIEHIVIVLKKSESVKKLITTVASPAIGETLDTLTEEYNLFYKLREQEAEKYRYGLYILPVLLALYIIYVLGQLKQAKEKLEERVKERTKKLDKALVYAQEASQAKSQFLSSMSHELRTPLTSILGFAQILDMANDETSHEERQKHLNNIIQAGDHLLSLINEVLDLSHIESGQLKIELESVLLSNVVIECINQINAAFVNKQNITLINKNNFPDIKVQADPQRLRQIIINLLSNAVKYNQRDGTVTIESELVGEDRLRILITDTGLGIASSDIEKLFEPFERLTFRHGQIEGSGIGLTVTKKLIEAMGGRIGVDSTINKGSTFWVELQLVAPVNQIMEA